MCIGREDTGYSLLVVQKVVGHVVARVSEYATTISSCRRIPVPEDDSVCELPERCREGDEKRRWHDQSVFVHREVVVDAVKEEM